MRRESASQRRRELPKRSRDQGPWPIIRPFHRGPKVYPLLQAGLNVTAIGISVVFILLTLLVGIIRGMSAICRMIENAMPQAASPAGSQPAAQSDQQLVSVISAAIAAHRKRR